MRDDTLDFVIVKLDQVFGDLLTAVRGRDDFGPVQTGCVREEGQDEGPRGKLSLFEGYRVRLGNGFHIRRRRYISSMKEYKDNEGMFGVGTEQKFRPSPTF
jgi:hypothetical protein